MQFRVATANAAQDARDIESLLREVYVNGGFTESTVADSAFAAIAVFNRAHVLVARDPETKNLSGMVNVSNYG